MTARPDSPEAGLSMIEVLVAVAVLGMALALTNFLGPHIVKNLG